MEDDGNCCNTDTIPIPLMDIGKRTVPVICPWCNVIGGVARWKVGSQEEIHPVHRICGKCMDFVNQGRG